MIGLLTAAGCSTSDGDGFSAGVDMQFEVAPSRVDFFPTSLGSISERTFQVRHVGNEGTLELTDITLETPSADLHLQGPDSISLGPGEHAEWIVHFAPTGFSAVEAAVHMNHNVNGRDPIEIPVTTPSQLGQLAVEPSVVDFGPVVSGTTAIQSVWLRNTGVETLDIQGLKLLPGTSQDFELVLAESVLHHAAEVIVRMGTLGFAIAFGLAGLFATLILGRFV